MSTPLDKQHVIVENSLQKKMENYPALHPRWVERVQFVSYQPPPGDISDRGQYEEWCERLKFIEDDLHWMLQLPHDKFWCQAVFDETFHKLIDSYLRFAPRSFDAIGALQEDAKERHDEVHRLVFLNVLRLATHKESKDHHITPSVFGEIIYENFIFDIPKLLDICALYGGSNGPLVSKMVENIFTQQPKYLDDLKQTVMTLGQVFDNIMVKCGVRDETGSPQRLGEGGVRGRDQLVTMATPDFQDVVLYVSDTGLTLAIFLQVYPAASTVFHHTDFLQRLAVFYDMVMPELFAALKQRELDPSAKMVLKQKLIQAKKSYLSLFQMIISLCLIQPLLEKRELAVDLVEDYLQLMSSILGERRFLADYESLHSFQGDLEILSQTSCVDETRIQYIHDAVNHAFSTYGRRKAPKGAMKRGGRRSPDGSPGPLDDGAVGGAVGGASPVTAQSTNTCQEPMGESVAAVSGVELDSLISSVKDLLPELGEGFIEACLREMDHSTERVVNALLEDRLPAPLQNLNRHMARVKRLPSPKLLVQERKNVFDYDEFDVFHRDDVNTDRITIGKSSKTDKVSLDDHLTMRDLKDAISKDYGVVVDIEEIEPGDQFSRDIYDDEYDDTYDTNVVGADDADDADELTTRRPFTVPRILGGRGVGGTDSDNKGGETLEEPEEDEPTKPRDQFVEDPAVLRARAEERRRSKAGKSSNPQPRNHDVKGGPKGQGQSSEVLRNRRFKTQHKGDNRRQLADKKRKV